MKVKQSCADLIGQLLRELESHDAPVQGVNVHIGALVNDTVGTLAAVRYVDGSDTVAAVIMGTGGRTLPCRGLGGQAFCMS